ncbi:MAG: hypothetical protein JXR33_01600 [Coriobacteriia bacterium]|nr:hypothetical protein [Coriobacteriia bacterium]
MHDLFSDTIARLRMLAGRARAAAVRQRRQILAVCVAGVLATLLAGPVSLAIPTTCSVCHADTGEYEEWRQSSHAGVACQYCHVERGYLGGLGNSVLLLSEAGRVMSGNRSDVAWVPDCGCVACHPDIGDEQPFTTSGLRMQHAGLAAGGYRCVECHAEVAHVRHPDRMPQPTMSTCAACHNNVQVSGRCETCHSGERSSDEARRRDAELAKTHGGNWKSLHGMGDLDTCTLCHEPSKCEACHDIPLPHDSGFGANHGSVAVSGGRESCLTCHTSSFCDSCHGIEMPHPDGFLPAHSSLANGLEDPLCIRCHTTANCAECHKRHVHPGGADEVQSQ